MRMSFLGLGLAVVAGAWRVLAGDPGVAVTDPPTLAVRVGASSSLAIDPPDTLLLATNRPAPANLSPAWRSGMAWPTGGRDKAGAWGLASRYDDDGSLILGGLFRQVLPGTVRVVSAEDGTEYVAGRDFQVNEEWAQVANVGGRLGEPGAGMLRIEARVALQRIDLVQADGGGMVTVKRGVSRLVCPERPVPDEGCRPLAGLYVAPWKRAGKWCVMPQDILPIRAVPEVAPIAPGAVERTLGKLRRGEAVTLAFLGDSITLGAEAGRWWDDASTTWRGRVLDGLRQRFPKATVREVQAFQGGRGIEYGLDVFEKAVRPEAPDLLFLQIGINDASDPAGTGHPAVPVEEFAGHFDRLVGTAREAGMEVVILTTMQYNPFDASGTARRWPDYVAAQKDVAGRHGAGVADTLAAWMAQEDDGVPPFSQLHNWINHPGTRGHALFASVVLRFFPAQPDGMP